MISLLFQFLLLILAILKHRQYFLMLQTLKLNNKKRKKSSFYEEKNLVWLTPDLHDTWAWKLVTLNCRNSTFIQLEYWKIWPSINEAMLCTSWDIFVERGPWLSRYQRGFPSFLSFPPSVFVKIETPRSNNCGHNYMWQPKPSICSPSKLDLSFI